MQIFQNNVIQAAIIQPQSQNSSLTTNLNTKQKLKHIPVVIIFLVTVLLIAGGIIPLVLFFGNYMQIGITFNSNYIAQRNIGIASCSTLGLYVTQNRTQCTNNCINGTPYLQKYCIDNAHLSSIQFESADLIQQISINNLKQSFFPILITTGVTLLISLLSLAAIIMFPKIIYFLIFLTFFFLVGLAFYILKIQKNQLNNYPDIIFEGSIYYKDQTPMRHLAYILLITYLVVFPIVFFEPKKIKAFVEILTLVKNYYKQMVSVQILSIIKIILIWFMLNFQYFVILMMYSSGDQTIQQSSFLILFTGSASVFSHPAIMVIHGLRIYWLYSTLIGWHQSLLNASFNMWYFSQNYQYKSLKRSLKKSRKRFGAVCISGLLLIPQWVILFLYSLFYKLTSQKISQNPFSNIYSNNNPFDAKEKLLNQINNQMFFTPQKKEDFPQFEQNSLNKLINEKQIQLSEIKIVNQQYFNKPINQRNSVQRSNSISQKILEKLRFGTLKLISFVNRGHTVTGTYPNLSYFKSCLAYIKQYQNDNCLFNVGNINSILLILFNVSFWMLTCEIVLDNIKMSKFPGVISSSFEGLIGVFLISLVVGCFMVNILSTVVQSAIYDFNIEKKSDKKNILGRKNIYEGIIKLINEEKLSI